MSFESQIEKMEIIATALITETDIVKVAQIIKDNSLADAQGRLLAPYLEELHCYLTINENAKLRNRTGAPTARVNDVIIKLYDAIARSKQYLDSQ